MSTLRMTVAVDNRPGEEGLIAEHGLSIWLEHAGHCVLFDTGQGRALFHNTRPLNIALDDIDSVCISHGHYDHLGGLPVVLAQATMPRLFVHPGAFARKYSRVKEARGIPRGRYIGVSRSEVATIRKLSNVVWTDTPMPVMGGMYITGPIPRITEYEDTGGPFFTDRECREPDPLTDDQALYVYTSEGLVVVLGCAHAGVVNTLTYIQWLTNSTRIHTVVGGMHLGGASARRIDATIDALRGLKIQRLMPLHCTGAEAMVRLSEAFPEAYVEGTVGTVAEWN